jgi:hypothetical protein
MFRLPLICLLSFTTLFSCAADDNAPAAADPYQDLIVWQLNDLDRPESAYVDGDIIYLSQIVGAGDQMDGVGYVSKVSLDGEMIDPHWVGGLNAPKGIRGTLGNLYVSDIDAIVEINQETGASRRIAVQGATFLNDVAAGPDGGVYSSDMRNSRIIEIHDGEVSVLATGPQLECPNGLLVHDGRLIVGGWASGGEITDTAIGHLYSLDFDTHEKTLITEEPTGNLDGIEIDGDGGYIVSDWKAGKILHISEEGEVKVLMELTQGAADHAYLPDRHLLILPRMLENSLVAYDISSLLE